MGELINSSLARELSNLDGVVEPLKEEDDYLEALGKVPQSGLIVAVRVERASSLVVDDREEDHKRTKQSS